MSEYEILTPQGKRWLWLIFSDILWALVLLAVVSATVARWSYIKELQPDIVPIGLAWFILIAARVVARWFQTVDEGW